MATNLSFSNRVVHFHFLSQKTCTANPLLGHGMIKLPTPLRVTRIVVRASYPPHEKLQPERGTYYEDQILNLLEKPESETVARELSVILTNIGENPQLYDLCSKILKEKSEHISKMWDIAGCNHTDTATAILPREPRSSVEWNGFISKDWWSLLIPKGHPEFPLKDKFKMTIERDSVHEYRVVFQGISLLGISYKSLGISSLDKIIERTLLEGHLYTDVKAKYSHFAFICGEHLYPDVNAKDSHLASKYGDIKHGVPDKHSSSLNDQIVLYIRIAAPNVLVGEAKKRDRNASEKDETVLGKFVLVKHYDNK